MEDDPTGEILVKTLLTICLAPIITLIIIIFLPFVVILGGGFILYQLYKDLCDDDFNIRASLLVLCITILILGIITGVLIGCYEICLSNTFIFSSLCTIWEVFWDWFA